MALTLVTGGARSGKSRWAEELASRCGERVLYVATASLTTGAAALDEGVDEEMFERIEHHRTRRPSSWSTLEEPYNIDTAIAAWVEQNPSTDAVLVDCLTLWVSNWLVSTEPESEHQAQPLVERAVATAAALAQLQCPVVAVTNEVGLGLVPNHPLGRLFRDLAGRVNQVFARQADLVYAVWAGIPVEIKALDARRRHDAPC